MLSSEAVPVEEHIKGAIETLYEQAGITQWFLEKDAKLVLPAWCATIDILGSWKGNLGIVMEEDLLRIIGQKSLGFGERPSLDDFQDAIGELANIFAGHVKAFLPGPTKLSSPRPWSHYLLRRGEASFICCSQGTLALHVVKDRSSL
jgi:hypothetical protein